MILILRSLHLDYEHVQDQILSSEQIPSMNSLVTRLLRPLVVDEEAVKLICTYCGKEGHLQNRCYDLIGWPNKIANISLSDTPSYGRIGSQLISDEEYREFLRLSPTITPNHLHYQVFQLHAFPSPWGVNFMQALCVDHWAAVLHILRYIKKTPVEDLPLINDLLQVSWKFKKQNIVARAEAEYRAMALATCELIWVKQLIQELKFADVQPMKLYCDNQATLHIAFNPVFHERTKHIEIDCHFVREKLLAKEISTEFVNSNNQLADIFTKSLRGSQIQA
ncbi:Copia protein, partial [Mucuna pruriens]